jgi:hexosaminidase
MFPVLITGAALATAPAPRPQTVPAVRAWRGGTSGLSWSPVPGGRVTGAFPREARHLTHDLHGGGVVLVRRPGLARQGYELRVGARVRILASTSAGAFYGGRTLLKLGASVPYGVARDRPRYPERAVMIDDGRAFFSRAWLAGLIRRMGRLKLDELHLHLSDDQGMRIFSDTHPEAVTKPFLTRADVTALVGVARRNHVQLVPEIDMPGHLTAALRAHPELQLTNVAGQRQPDKLDVTKPAARKFALDLIDGALGAFGARTWHIGADEYLGVASTPLDYAEYPQLQRFAQRKYGSSANGKDAVLDFVNTVAAHLAARGVRARVWSDGVGGGGATALDKQVSVEWWDDVHSPAPEDLVAQGYRVLNTGWWPLYYVTGGALRDHRVPVEQMYEDWSPWRFDGELSPRFGSPALASEHSLAPGERRQRGASLAVWNDDPTAPGAKEAAVAAGIHARLRVLAQKTWGSPQLTSGYAAFSRIR